MKIIRIIIQDTFKSLSDRIKISNACINVKCARSEHIALKPNYTEICDVGLQIPDSARDFKFQILSP